MGFNPFRISRAKQRFGGEIIHSERDQYGLIQVIDSPICRSLHFDTPVKQSRYFFNAPYQLAFEYQQVMEQRLNEFSKSHALKRLLMLGVGGGSLASKLFISQPKLEMTLVDLRQSVIDIAHDFFHLPFHSRIQTHCDDAGEFVHQQSGYYDAIVVDAYDESGLPSVFTQADFLEALLCQTRTPGLVLFNLWQSTPEPTLKVIQYFDQHGEIDLYPTKSSKNLVLLYRKS